MNIENLKVGSLIKWSEDNDLGIVLEIQVPEDWDDQIWMKVFWLEEGDRDMEGTAYDTGGFEVLA